MATAWSDRSLEKRDARGVVRPSGRRASGPPRTGPPAPGRPSAPFDTSASHASGTEPAASTPGAWPPGPEVGGRLPAPRRQGLGALPGPSPRRRIGSSSAATSGPATEATEAAWEPEPANQGSSEQPEPANQGSGVGPTGSTTESATPATGVRSPSAPDNGCPSQRSACSRPFADGPTMTAAATPNRNGVPWAVQVVRGGGGRPGHSDRRRWGSGGTGDDQ